MPSGNLTARLVPSDQVESFDKLAFDHGCLFDRIKWTSAFEPDLKRFGIYDAGGTLRGGFSLYEERRFGLKVLRNPPFTPQVGPFFECLSSNPAAKTSERRAVIEAMATLVSDSGAAVVSLGLAPDTTDCLPFYWRGYKTVSQYTYRLDLSDTAAQVLNGMSRERRNDISKAERDGLQVTEAQDTTELRRLVCTSFGRQEKSFPARAMDRLLFLFPPGSNSFAFVTHHDGEPVAAVYVVHDERTAYYVMGGYGGRAPHHGAGALATHRAILKSLELGLRVFDFEGSVIPAIERYFRGFGGQLTPMLSVHKAWLPLEMLLKLRYRQQF